MTERTSRADHSWITAAMRPNRAARQHTLSRRPTLISCPIPRPSNSSAISTTPRTDLPQIRLRLLCGAAAGNRGAAARSEERLLPRSGRTSSVCRRRKGESRMMQEEKRPQRTDKALRAADYPTFCDSTEEHGSAVTRKATAPIRNIGGHELPRGSSRQEQTGVRRENAGTPCANSKRAPTGWNCWSRAESSLPTSCSHCGKNATS
ncbi:MAG: hypothetical protein JWQ44_1376 [Chthoniobacter sp.]|nr:hypothetical protein [Chthoniobacter sp.]